MFARHWLLARLWYIRGTSISGSLIRDSSEFFLSFFLSNFTSLPHSFLCGIWKIAFDSFVKKKWETRLHWRRSEWARTREINESYLQSSVNNGRKTLYFFMSNEASPSRWAEGGLWWVKVSTFFSVSESGNIFPFFMTPEHAIYIWNPQITWICMLRVKLWYILTQFYWLEITIWA